VRHHAGPGEEKIEIVGSIDAGITAACWSPDEELLVVATRADTILFMTADFEVASNITLLPEDAKLSKHVNVGWGKSETQFRGRGARALRDPTMPEKVDQGTLSALDAGQVTISWRGDGAYVAVNSVEGGARRMVRVYSREGTLDSVSQPVDGLEGALNWRPSGNLLAGIQRIGDDVNVVMFERNGLRHGQFALRSNRKDKTDLALAIDLKWNVDSTTLAVSFPGRLQLWTMGNYHYYLKQDLHVLKAGPKDLPLSVTWHPEAPLRVILGQTQSKELKEKGLLETESDELMPITTIHSLEYIFTTAIGSTSVPVDYGTTVVMDGCE